jgi:hypothetical protein
MLEEEIDSPERSVGTGAGRRGVKLAVRPSNSNVKQNSPVTSDDSDDGHGDGGQITTSVDR